MKYLIIMLLIIIGCERPSIKKNTHPTGRVGPLERVIDCELGVACYRFNSGTSCVVLKNRHVKAACGDNI